MSFQQDCKRQAFVQINLQFPNKSESIPWLKPLKIKAVDFHSDVGCPPLDLFSIPDSPPAINSVMTGTINHCLVPGHWATSEYADTVCQNRSRPHSPVSRDSVVKHNYLSLDACLSLSLSRVLEAKVLTTPGSWWGTMPPPCYVRSLTLHDDCRHVTSPQH